MSALDEQLTRLRHRYGVADFTVEDLYDDDPVLRAMDGTLVDTWREAVVKQLLTPAPDGAAVAWKRAKLAGRGFSHLPTKAERIERVIAEDLAFLAAHPVRQSKRKTTGGLSNG
jgi:hypothetical protein